MAHIISSQLDVVESIVENYMEMNDDFTVTLSPELEIDGEMYQTIIDGHHRLEAARRLGIEPTYVIADRQMCDYINLATENPEEFLEQAWIDCSWYHIDTGIMVW